MLQIAYKWEILIPQCSKWHTVARKCSNYLRKAPQLKNENNHKKTLKNTHPLFWTFFLSFLWVLKRWKLGKVSCSSSTNQIKQKRSCGGFLGFSDNANLWPTLFRRMTMATCGRSAGVILCASSVIALGCWQWSAEAAPEKQLPLAILTLAATWT